MNFGSAVDLESRRGGGRRFVTFDAFVPTSFIFAEGLGGSGCGRPWRQPQRSCNMTLWAFCEGKLRSNEPGRS